MVGQQVRGFIHQIRMIAERHDGGVLAAGETSPEFRRCDWGGIASFDRSAPRPERRLLRSTTHWPFFPGILATSRLRILGGPSTRMKVRKVKSSGSSRARPHGLPAACAFRLSRMWLIHCSYSFTRSPLAMPHLSRQVRGWPEWSSASRIRYDSAPKRRFGSIRVQKGLIRGRSRWRCPSTALRGYLERGCFQSDAAQGADTAGKRTPRAEIRGVKWSGATHPAKVSLMMPSMSFTSSLLNALNSPSRRFFGSVPLFCRTNMIRFSATRSGISTASIIRLIASS
jgi:hypothetical protein